MEVAVTTGAIRCAKFQSSHHHQQTNTHFLQAGCPSCRPTNSIEGKELSMNGECKISSQNSDTSCSVIFHSKKKK